MLSQISKIIIKSSVITNRLSITMAALIIDYVLAPIRQPYYPVNIQKIFHDQFPRKNVADPAGSTRNLLITGQTRIQSKPRFCKANTWLYNVEQLTGKHKT